MPIIGIWLDSRLKELFIESKMCELEFGRERYGRPKLEYTRSHTIAPIHTNSGPEGCRSILETPVNAIFNPNLLR